MSATEHQRDVLVWKGAAEFEGMLVSVEAVQPTPWNVRQGDVPLIADSLRRFGQLTPVVLDEAGNILKGNNVHRAAVEMLGWSHLACVTADHMSEDDRVLYVLADNQTSDSARTNPESAVQLQRLLVARAESGQVDDEIAALLRAAAAGLERAAQRAESPGHGSVIDVNGLEIEHCCEECGYEWSGGAGGE